MKNSDIQGPFQSTINIISLLIGIISLISAVYFYNQSKSIQELIFYESPNRISLVNIEDATGLSVSVQGEQNIKNLTSTSVAIWNNGNKIIKKNNILKPIKLILPDDVKVVGGIKVEKIRDQFDFKVTKSPDKNNLLNIEWDFLKKGDGVLVQFFHTGPTSTQTKIIGELDEQERIFTLDSFKNRYKSHPLSHRKPHNS